VPSNSLKAFRKAGKTGGQAHQHKQAGRMAERTQEKTNTKRIVSQGFPQTHANCQKTVSITDIRWLQNVHSACTQTLEKYVQANINAGPTTLFERLHTAQQNISKIKDNLARLPFL